MWFITFTSKLTDTNKKIDIFDRLGKEIASDIEKQKPSPLLLMLDSEGKSALSTVYKNHPQFQKALSEYELKETKTLNNAFNKYRDDLDVIQRHTYDKMKNKSLTFEIYTRIE
jgi:hypothetical protein